MMVVQRYLDIKSSRFEMLRFRHFMSSIISKNERESRFQAEFDLCAKFEI